ncbi:MAG TPA: GDP-mannose 4,6-dehydratase [Cellulomonas sp.]
MTVALVTGATGQDGSYLCERLAAEGVRVHALVRAVTGPERDPGLDDLLRRTPDVVVHEGDLADGPALSDLLQQVAPDEVYNLAGISSVAYSWQEPALTGLLSGVAVASVLDGALRVQRATGRPVRVVQASSAEIFGDATEVPQNESTPVRPRSPYGAAKAYAHQMVGVSRSQGLHASSVILYNHESPRRPLSFVTRKITHGVARIAAGLDTELTLGSTDVTRDWGWAPDYVEAMVLAARHDEPDDFVVATGEPHTVADFVRAAFERAGVPDWADRVRTDPAFVRPAESTVQLGDATKAHQVLGWQPTHRFSEVVAAMVDHDLALLTDDDGTR